MPNLVHEGYHIDRNGREWGVTISKCTGTIFGKPVDRFIVWLDDMAATDAQCDSFFDSFDTMDDAVAYVDQM